MSPLTFVINSVLCVASSLLEVKKWPYYLGAVEINIRVFGTEIYDFIADEQNRNLLKDLYMYIVHRHINTHASES